MTNYEMELYGETGMQQLRDELMHLQELTAKNEKNNVERLQAEIVALKHDIERHVELNAKLTTKNEELQEMLEAVQKNSGINFRMWQEAQAEVERLKKENKELAADRPEMEEVNGHWEWKKPNGEQQLPNYGED